MRRLPVVLSFLIVACSSSPAQKPPAPVTAQTVIAPDGERTAAAETPGAARGAPAARGEVTPPAEDTIAKNPTLKSVEANQWVPFGGAYFRLWGGAWTGSQPKGVSASPDGQHVYVTNVGFHDRENVWRYDPATLKIVTKANFKGNAIESVPSADSKILYVSNFYHRQLLALDAVSLKVKKIYTVENMPKHFAFSPDGATLYVSNWASATTSVIDVASGDAKLHIKVGKQPRGTIATRDGKKVYVTNFGGNTVSVIDTAKLEVVKTIEACPAPRHGAITADDRLLLVSCYSAKDVIVIDTTKDEVVRKVEVGLGPKTIEISHDQQFAYTADYKGSTMSIIDLGSWDVLVLPVPTVKTSGLAISPDDRRVYLTGWDSRNLLVFERLLPGDRPGALGPKGPGAKCLRATPEECKRFP